MTTELTLVQETVSLPVTVEDAIRQWNEYQALTRQLLDASDYQAIGQKQFKKKSAWRKFARAFNITDCVTFEEIHRAEDGFPIWARIRVTASATNGRTAEADHECHISERCCSAAQGQECRQRTWRGHTCCTPACSMRLHWAHPGDIPATALTRAKNRAIADLIGAGEVSAEEMIGQRDQAVEGEVITRQPSEAVRQSPPRAARATPAVAVDGIDQLGPYRAPNGSMNGMAFMAALGREGLTTDDLATVATPAAGGSKADVGGWLRANADKTLDDLISIMKLERGSVPDAAECAEGEHDLAFNEDGVMVCRKCAADVSEEAEA